MKLVAIIDYESGNLHSAAKAFEKAASVTGHRVEVTNQPEALSRASHIVLPGVGAFGDCARGLRAVPGMVEALEHQVRMEGKPFLGICVGMQLLAQKGHEHGEHQGFGWLEGEVMPLRSDLPEQTSLKIPHMGWNTLIPLRAHPLLEGLGAKEDVYFVHSYHMHCQRAEDIVATSEYGTSVTAVVARENIMGVQFHPEKSQRAGQKIIMNFLQMDGV